MRAAKMEESEPERKVGARLGSARGASSSESRDPGLTRVSLQRVRTDEAGAAGSRSEAEDEDDEDYVPYVPLRQRRQLLVRVPGRRGNADARGGGVRSEGGGPGLRGEVSVRGSVAPGRRWPGGLI